MATGGGGGGRQAGGRYDNLSGEKKTRNRWEVLGTPRNNGGERRGEQGGLGGVNLNDRGMRREERMSEGGGNEGVDNAGRVVENEGGRKRNLEERSPGVHEGQRNSRRRMNEFEMGEVFEKIIAKMNVGIEDVVNAAPDGFRKDLRAGLDVLVEGIKGVMNGISDGIAGERLAREAEEIRTEDKMEKMLEEIKVIKRTSGNIAEDRIEQRVKDSEKEMEDKVRAAGCGLKIMDFDFEEQTEDRVRMVRKVLRTLKEDTFPEDRIGYERIMRRTRLVILGRKTTQVQVRGRTVFTVPVLLECQNRVDAGDLEVILKKAGYFSSFHWPREITEFINGVREEVRKMGFRDGTHFIRIRPEERGGRVQIRADVKEKNRGRFYPKAVWQCPPPESGFLGFVKRTLRRADSGAAKIDSSSTRYMRKSADRWGWLEWERVRLMGKQVDRSGGPGEGGEYSTIQ
jgi:hypothetical protein